MFFFFAFLSLSHPHWHHHHRPEEPKPTPTPDIAHEAFNYFGQVIYLDLIATVCGFGTCFLFFVVLYYIWTRCRQNSANEAVDQSIPPVQQQREVPLIVREQQQQQRQQQQNRVRQSPVPAPNPYIAQQPVVYQPYPSPYANEV